MSFSLYIGSEPPYKAGAGAWDHDLSGHTVQERLHGVTHQTIPSLSNEELYIVVGRHGDADITRDQNIMAMNLDPARGIMHAIVAVVEEIVERELDDLRADLTGAREDLERDLNNLDTKVDEVDSRVTDLESPT